MSTLAIVGIAGGVVAATAVVVAGRVLLAWIRKSYKLSVQLQPTVPPKDTPPSDPPSGTVPVKAS